MSATATTWVLVSVAGAVGTLLRYVIGGWVAKATGEVFPWETWAINVVGSLVIGVLAGAVDQGALLPSPVRTALMVGLIGGFTTFSSFALEALRLSQGGEWRSAILYILMTNACGLVAAWLGYAAAKNWT